jgi:phosphoribosylglycinamide formyltransferase-1
VGLVSGSGTNMMALADACRRGEVPGVVAAVIADRACRAVSAARERGIDALVVEPGTHLSRDRWNEALLEHVLAYEPDLVVSAGFMRILGPVFVDALEGRLVNLHPSLLPAFPGAHAVRDALDAGVRVTGTTVHFVDREVDHGPILLQEPVRVLPGDTEQTLHDRIKVTEHDMLARACKMLLSGRARLAQGRVLVDEPGA